MNNKKTIISVSRRTDIPAYYADWFRSRLDKGYVYYKNPFSNSPVFADLSPDKVKAFVFWSRNPYPLFKYLDYIDEKYSRHHYMHFTINGLPEELERRNPKVDYAISSMEFLAKRYGDEYAQWRFDPIVLSTVSNFDYLLNRFSEIATKLNGMTKRCYFSFVDLYDKTKLNFKKLSLSTEIEFYKPSLEERISFTKEIDLIAEQNGITLYACAEDELLNAVPRIVKAKCVDSDIIHKICSEEKNDYKAEPSRLGCGCIESKDIGYYDSCPHGCIYCYANRDPEKALENARKYLKEGFTFDDMEHSEQQLKLF